MQYLKFPDEATARATTGWWSDDSWIQPSPRLQIAVRGVLYNSDGIYDNETGACLTPPTAREGFHIDVLYGDVPQAAQVYIVTPKKPDFVLA
ncbi:hypothetical protein [Enterobacter oligotrophicus]|uniref:hypothetical protein n=1 Tax=Enterobacter oligotrophicus TaxID=2478464 RepID=UPI0023F026D8|nr:hypothetical protein [Enterobacter oligotrophicus]